MLLDRSLTEAFKNFSTLFLLVAVFTVPLHLVYSFVFRDVIALSELHSRVSELPSFRLVRGVGSDRLTDYRIAFVGLTLIEIALIPLLAKAADEVVEVEEQGGVPTVLGALGRIGSGRPSPVRALSSGTVPGLVALVVFALVVGWLAERVGLLVVDLLGDPVRWFGAGLVRGVARALGAPFLLIATVVSSRLT